MYEKRTYRQQFARSGLASFVIKIGQSDLHIQCGPLSLGDGFSDKLRDYSCGDKPRDSTEIRKKLQPIAQRLLGEVREQVEQYIRVDGAFQKSLQPLAVLEDAGAVITQMAAAAEAWNVGPMAAVAGAVAQYVGEGLLGHCEEVIVENGGDIYAKTTEPLIIGLYAGERSPFRDKLKFKVDTATGMGICTSSGVVGPSLSFGRADAVVAMSKDVAFADAAATAIANTINKNEDVDASIRKEQAKGLLDGLIICINDRLGLFGNIELVKKV